MKESSKNMSLSEMRDDWFNDIWEGESSDSLIKKFSIIQYFEDRERRRQLQSFSLLYANILSAVSSLKFRWSTLSYDLFLMIFTKIGN